MSKKKHKVIVDVNPHSVCGGKVHERHDGVRVRYYSPGYASRNRRSIPRRAAKPFLLGWQMLPTLFSPKVLWRIITITNMREPRCSGSITRELQSCTAQAHLM